MPTSQPDSARGACHGFEILSPLRFRTLRTGSGAPLRITVDPALRARGKIIAEWLPRPNNPFHGRLLKDGERYAFWASDAGWYQVNPKDGSIALGSSESELARELRLFGVPVSICVFEQGDLSIHASAVEVNGHGVILAGPSRYGKTTLAAGFAAAGHRVLSEDTTRCTTSNGVPSIFPGPAVLRLRDDVAKHVNVLGGTRVGLGTERVAILFDESVRGGSTAIPLRAIVFLQESATPPRLEPIAAASAIPDIFALMFRLPVEPFRTASFTRVADLAARVQALRLHREKTVRSLGEVVALLERYLSAG